MSKFKVGDRVRTTVWDFGFPPGTQGTVNRPYAAGYDISIHGVADPDDGGEGWHYYPHELELMNVSPPNTVRVRIAVAVADDGGWSARGGSGESDRYVASRAGEDLTNARLSWVTVDVPLPEKPAEIQGVVE